MQTNIVHDLMLSKLLANSVDNKLGEIFLIFPRKQDLTFLCKLSLLEKICMKCQILFSRENKKNKTKMLPAEIIIHSMLSIKRLK